MTKKRIICAAHGCRRLGVHRWERRFCAVSKSERRRVVYVCTPCDIEINETMVRFFFGRKKERELAAYRAEALA